MVGDPVQAAVAQRAIAGLEPLWTTSMDLAKAANIGRSATRLREKVTERTRLALPLCAKHLCRLVSLRKSRSVYRESKSKGDAALKSDSCQ